MTKTSGVDFGGRSFWVYDVVGGIFLYHLICAAEEHLITTNSSLEWLENSIRKWKVAAAITELAYYLDDRWPEEQLDLVLKLIRTANQKIRQTEYFKSKEVETWPLLDDLYIHCRGNETIPSEPIALFGEALIALANNTMRPPPNGAWWCYILDDSPATIDMGANWDYKLNSK